MGMLATVNNVAAIRQKVAQQHAAPVSSTLEVAKGLLQEMTVGTDVSSNEQMTRRLTQQKLSEDLVGTERAFVAAQQEFEERATAREKQLASEAAMAAANAARAANGRSLETQEDERKRQLQEQLLVREQRAEQAAMETFGVHVNETVEEVSTVQRNIHSLQRAMMSLADHVRDQGYTLDSIEAQMGQTAEATENATEQLQQTDQRQQKGSKRVCCLVITGMLFAAVVIVVVWHRSNG